jgi:hypothetical protein
MAVDYKWTEEEYQALKKSLASGNKIVRYEDKMVEVDSVSDRLKMLSRIEKELKLESGQKVRRQVRFTTSKGL